MRILVVTPEFPPSFGGGIGTFYGHLLPELVSAGADVTVILDNNSIGLEAEYVHKGVKVILLDRNLTKDLRSSFGSFSLSADLTHRLAAAWAAWRQAKQGQDFDIVECSDWGLYFVPWLLTNSNPPLVVRLHASMGQIAKHDPGSCSPLDAGLYQLIEAALLPQAHSLVTYSNSNQKFWQQSLNCTVSYFPPPLPTKNIDVSWFPESDNGVVFGRVQEWKGVRTLCQALETMGSTAPIIDWYGRVISSQETRMPLDDNLENFYPNIWGNKVVHHDPVEPKAVAKLQRSSSFVLVPSDWDVFNFTAIESMAQSVPVICSDGAGASEIILDGINGFVFEAGNASSLMDSIHRLTALSFAEKRILGMKARETVASCLDPSDLAIHTLEHFALLQSRENKYNYDNEFFVSALSPDDFVGSVSAIDRSLDSIDLKCLLRHFKRRVWTKIKDFSAK